MWWTIGRVSRGARRLRPFARDPVFLSPEYRVDPLLTRYAQSRSFRKHTRETRRNYATDLRLFLTFLSDRNHSWREATAKDFEDYEDWRRFAERNPRRIGGAKWDRELSASAGDDGSRRQRPGEAGSAVRVVGANVEEQAYSAGRIPSSA
jgi:hypothetical protein